MSVDLGSLRIRAKLMINQFIEKLPTRSKEVLKGAFFGLALAFPFYVAWLSFQKQDLFAFPYMREVSLVAIWGMCIFHTVPLKSLKFGKDGLELALKDQQISPEEAIKK